ncbi:hypothetical protein [Nocardioides terrisoli]|uniref:hypothetical protein n=1 Tax=Nocardioides terrisoli TaxID=3388267 RepID=UPI00287B8C6C|nr:hypothetical protein [Nocardioides marmorisolisilvae]
MIRKAIAGASLVVLAVGLGGVMPSANAATTAPATSHKCENAKAAAAKAKEHKANAKRDLAQAQVALRKANHTDNPNKIANAQKREQRAETRLANAKTHLHKANAQRRHNCTNADL